MRIGTRNEVGGSGVVEAETLKGGGQVFLDKMSNTSAGKSGAVGSGAGSARRKYSRVMLESLSDRCQV